MTAPEDRLRLFVATRRDDVPTECRRYASVDGSVPGAAVTWDHHRTGEAINLDAMPDRVEIGRFDGIGTTLADVDAVASAAAALLGGKACVPAGPLAVLESASHWCDHLAPHPAHDDAVNHEGRGFLDAVSTSLAAGSGGSGAFAAAVRDLVRRIRDGAPLPCDDRFEAQRRMAERLDAAGRILRRGPVALVDVRGRTQVDPRAMYELHECPVAVIVADHPGGGPRYTVGVNPRVAAPHDLGPALFALAAAEHAHGAPARAAEPVPDSENWGGRRSVFGSPWNYGSRLSPDEVVRIVTETLFPAR